MLLQWRHDSPSLVADFGGGRFRIFRKILPGPLSSAVISDSRYVTNPATTRISQSFIAQVITNLALPSVTLAPTLLGRMIWNFLIGALVGAILWRIQKTTKDILMKQSELEGKFNAMADQVSKIATEIKALKESLGDSEIPAAAQEALNRLSALIQSADELNEDAPTTPPETPV